MAYRVSLLPIASDEIYEAALYFSERFSGGDNSFLIAIEDTIERIVKMPGRGSPKHDSDPNIRAIRVQANSKRKVYAKKFPYLLIYKVLRKMAT